MHRARSISKRFAYVVEKEPNPRGVRLEACASGADLKVAVTRS
jgi:hypothetical protein